MLHIFLKKLLKMNVDKRKINKRLLIGIAGGSGSGKTFVAQNLLSR